jgi:ketosteroid isomerase-like protein
MDNPNLATVVRIYQCIFGGEVDRMEPLLAPGFYLIEAESLPYGGEYEGFQGFKSLLRKVAAFWNRTLVGEVERMIADGDWVIAVLRLRGRDPKTGERVSMSVCEVWECRDGKAVALWPYYWDTKRISDMAGDG